MSAHRRSLFALSFALVGLVYAREARCQAAACAQQATADQLSARARGLRDEGRHDEALPLFRQAYALCGDAPSAVRLGFCEGALGHFVEAEALLQQAIDTGGDAPWIAAEREAIDQALRYARQRLGTVEFTADRRVEVSIAGEARGSLATRRRFRVLAGEVRVALHASGCRAVSRVLMVAPEATARVTEAPVCEAPPRADGTLRTLAWVSAGAAVASLALGATAAGLYLDQAPQWNDDARCIPPNGLPRHVNCPDAWATVRWAWPTAWVGFGTAAVLGVTSALLFASSSSAGRATPSVAQWQCGQGPGDFGVACGRDF